MGLRKARPGRRTDREPSGRPTAEGPKGCHIQTVRSAKLKAAAFLAACWFGGMPGNAELLVSSHDSSRVLRYDAGDGSFMDVFVSNTNGALSAPHGLTFGPDGHLYVAS